MHSSELANFFAWCSIINYLILLVWFLVFNLGHDWLHVMHGRWFELTAQQFDLVNYCGMGLFKLLIFVFSLAPYLALRIIN
jgi:hypothetical protein